MNKQTGFTLLEILIVTLLLAFMGAMTFQSIRETARSKNKIERNLEALAGVRDTLSIISHDVNLAFHWRDINEDLKSEIIKSAKAQNKPIPPSLAATPDPNAKRIPLEKATQFIGNEKEMNFTTLSHVRTIVDSPESDQAEVGYFMKGKTLYRRYTPVLDENVEKGGTETPLLGNITQFKLAYLGGEPDDDWKSDWKSIEGLDDKTKGKFPSAVEITIETENEGLKTRLSTIAAIHMPNNDPIAPAPAASPTPGGPTR